MVTQTESCESFFNLFNPPTIPEDDNDNDEHDDALQDPEEQIEQDCELGRTIKDRIIPKAVDGYTVETINTMQFQLDRDGHHDDQDDDDEPGQGVLAGAQYQPLRVQAAIVACGSPSAVIKVPAAEPRGSSLGHNVQSSRRKHTNHVARVFRFLNCSQIYQYGCKGRHRFRWTSPESSLQHSGLLQSWPPPCSAQRQAFISLTLEAA